MPGERSAYAELSCRLACDPGHTVDLGICMCIDNLHTNGKIRVSVDLVSGHPDLSKNRAEDLVWQVW